MPKIAYRSKQQCKGLVVDQNITFYFSDSPALSLHRSLSLYCFTSRLLHACAARHVVSYIRIGLRFCDFSVLAVTTPAEVSHSQEDESGAQPSSRFHTRMIKSPKVTVGLLVTGR